jgi:hypothetical protein
MRAIQVSRKKLYELINTGEFESFTEGKPRRITIKSINEYIERRCALKSRCCPKQASRRVPRSIYEGARDMARSFTAEHRHGSEQLACLKGAHKRPSR